MTHVREDTLALFGFVVPGEKPVFKLLCEISGIGPRMALTILSGITPQELVSAVMGENTTRLQKIPGVGKRLAGRMIVELKDKLAKGEAGLPEMPEIPSAPEAASAPGVVDDLAMALGALGYSKAEIDRITRKVVADAPEEDRVEVLLKAALRELNPLRAGGRP